MEKKKLKERKLNSAAAEEEKKKELKEMESDDYVGNALDRFKKPKS
jgi:hypothetical protein